MAEWEMKQPPLNKARYISLYIVLFPFLPSLIVPIWGIITAAASSAILYYQYRDRAKILVMPRTGKVAFLSWLLFVTLTQTSVLLRANEIIGVNFSILLGTLAIVAFALNFVLTISLIKGWYV